MRAGMKGAAPFALALPCTVAEKQSGLTVTVEPPALLQSVLWDDWTAPGM